MSEEQDVQEFVSNLKELIQLMMPSLPSDHLQPQIIQLTSYTGGQGAGTIQQSGGIVNVLGHPKLPVSGGDIVVGVPIGPSNFYIVGKA